MAEQTASFPEPLIDEDESKSIAHKWKVIIGAVILVGALGYFGFLAFKSATVYYHTVGEVLEMGATQEGQVVRVSGKLVPTSFVRPEDSTVASFQLTDGTANLAASHDGVLPDLFFNAHSEIILEGSYLPDGVFVSQNVIVKCPSKYIAIDGEPPADEIIIQQSS